MHLPVKEQEPAGKTEGMEEVMRQMTGKTLALLPSWQHTHLRAAPPNTWTGVSKEQFLKQVEGSAQTGGMSEQQKEELWKTFQKNLNGKGKNDKQNRYAPLYSDIYATTHHQPTIAIPAAGLTYALLARHQILNPR